MCGKVASPGTLGMATTSRIIKTVQPKNWKNAEFSRGHTYGQVRLAPTKRCVPEFPAIRARSGARLPYLCDPAAFGASEQTGSCTRPPLAPGARRRPEGQPYECFWGPAQAAGPVLAAKMGMLWRSSWLKSRQLLLPPVSLPVVLPPYGFNKCPWAL